MNKRLMRTNLLAPIFLVLVTASSGFGQTLDNGTLYQIINKRSGKCLEVNGGPDAVWNGALVVQRDCNYATNQQWAFNYVGAGHYKIIAKHSGKSLDVFGGVFAGADQVIVEQWAYNGSTNQMWSVEALNNGYYSIVARHSNKALEVRDSSPDNGGQVQQNGLQSSPNQQWRLIDLAGRAPCPAIDPLTSIFTGTGELRTTNSFARGPFLFNVSWIVVFTHCRANIRITSVEPMTNSSDLVFGSNTSTITLTQDGAGSFNSLNGHTTIPITLGWENSFPRLGNSTLRLRLMAEGIPAYNPDTGILTLRGTGTFAGGLSNSSQGTLTITGTFSPRPR